MNIKINKCFISLVLLAIPSIGSAKRLYSPVADGLYYISPADQPNDYLDAYESANNNYRVVTRSFQGNNTQVWKVTYMDNTTSLYTIQQVSSGRYLEPKGDEGAEVVTAKINFRENQWWYLDLDYNERDRPVIISESQGSTFSPMVPTNHPGLDYKMVIGHYNKNVSSPAFIFTRVVVAQTGKPSSSAETDKSPKPTLSAETVKPPKPLKLPGLIFKP